MLHFFGRGSAFARDNTCAYFRDGGALVLLDFSLCAFQKFKALDFSDAERIYVLVTHTHGDHVSGIGTLIHYAKYCIGVPVMVVVPCEAIGKDMEYLLGTIEGCDPAAFEVLPVYALEEPWFDVAIETQHSASLAGRCFGYALRVEGKYVVYTGDTNTLSPYLAAMEANGNPAGTVLYTEASSKESGVHLYLEEHLQELLALCEAGTNVCLMHLDDEEKIRQMIEGTPLQIVEVD